MSDTLFCIGNILSVAWARALTRRWPATCDSTIARLFDVCSCHAPYPRYCLQCADPCSRDPALRLCEQAEVEAPRLLRWLEAEARVEDGAQALIPFGDGFAEPQRAFRFHCESPERLI